MPSQSPIRADIRAVAFDAVGTLIHPQTSIAQEYAVIGRRHGSRLTDDIVHARFKAAFKHQEDLDRVADWVTNEDRELRRWREIVAEVLDDVASFEPCFADLYARFAEPNVWRLDDHAAEVIASLRDRGYKTALASNFDSRLHSVVAGLPGLKPLNAVVVSSEVGMRKPGRKFFAAIAETLGFPIEQIAFVGDDPINDAQGAADAGMRSYLVGRDGNLREIAGVL